MLQLRADKLSLYLQLMRVDRPIGTWLVMWPALWALWLAARNPPEWHLVIIFIVGAFLMRSAGCVINDYADRHIDGHVERTRHRPMAQRAVDEREALQLFALLCLLAALLLVFTNALTRWLAFAAVVLAAIYPFAKRVTHLPQAVLGVAFSWAVPMAFAAQADTVPALAWQLCLAVITWVVAYDTVYAMVDRNDDLQIGVKSSAILFGRYDRVATGALQFLFIVQMALLGVQQALGGWYFIALIGAAVLFAYQQWLIRDRDRHECLQAFLNNHYVGLLLFAGIALDFYRR